MKEFTVKENSTLKNFTDNTYPQGSFCFRILLKNRDIRINGKKTDRDTVLRTGDVVRYYTTAAQESRIAYLPVYEDENILVVDKESGVNSEAVFASLSLEKQVFFIHRLDRNTEGLMIFAKNAKAEDALLSAFRERKIEKIYQAVCVGTFSQPKALLSAYLTKDDKTSTVRISDTDGTYKILTEYEVVRSEGELNLVQICLHTGKTHQIRAHMAHIGCPVLGDTKYGNREANAKYQVSRQRLLAKELRLFTDGVLAYLKNKKFVSERELKI